MNVIGHMTCAEHLGAEIALGAMLPDLLSLYDRAIRPRRLLQGAEGAESAALREGVRFHFHVDAHFHRSELFKECAELVRERLLAASRAPGLKRFAVGHILAELFFDHLLIVERPARLAGFYDALDFHREVPLESLLAGHEGIDRAGFSAFLARLVHARFADDYLERDGLLGRMDRILLRLRQRRLEPAEREAALDGLAGHAARARAQLHDFIGAMRDWPSPGARAPARDSAVDSGGLAGLK
jgi:hypothetical protein